MALSTGYNRVRTAVLISGTGSNLKSLIKFSKSKKSPMTGLKLKSVKLIPNYGLKNAIDDWLDK